MAQGGRKFDIVIIGAGQAGIFACKAAVESGKKVCVVEQSQAGGECPSSACIPSKTLLASARRYLDMRFAGDLGLYGSPTFDFKAIMHRSNQVVRAATGDGQRFKKMITSMRAEYVHGRATFVDTHVIDVEGRKIHGKAFIIATGGEVSIPPIKGLDTSKIWTFKDIGTIKKLPSSLVIIGGGPVGVEMATFFAAFGTRVTILERSKEILGNIDTEIAAISRNLLKELDVAVYTKTVAVEIQNKFKKSRVIFDFSGELHHVDTEKVLVATGKKPNISGLGLEDIGVKLKDGEIDIKQTRQTSVKHIFVAGDVSIGPRYTHFAHYEGGIAGMNAVASLKRSPKYQKANTSIVPNVVFSYPEIAQVGLTAEQAKANKKEFILGTSHASEVWRANTDGVSALLCKIIIEKRTGKILGATLLGPGAGEIVHEIAVAMHAGMKAEKLAEMIFAFPTYSEAVRQAIHNAYRKN